MLRWLFKPLALLLGVALFLAGLIALGRLALDSLREQNRCTLPFAEIACVPPLGMSRVDFLDEVQYLASLPGNLNLLEDGLAQRLAQGFAQHPWVARVEQVEVVPPRRVEVRLRYRKPALAVRFGGRTRVVDDQGVLLPAKTSGEGLPVFPGKAAPPTGRAGTVWGNAAVEAAARAAGKRAIEEAAH